jgi:CRP-like cAMP-binding protein
MGGVLWYLKRCDLFEKITRDEAIQLSQNARMRRFRRGAVVYGPGEPGESVMIVADGRVKIKDISKHGKEAILAFIDEGEVFGELALVDGNQRREFAEAVEDSLIIAIPRADFLALLEGRPDLTLSIVRMIGLRRQRLENRLRNVLFLSGRARMAHLLLELAESHGRRAGNEFRIELKLKHQELAALVGIARETVTTTLGQFQDEGLIRRDGRLITILDARRLANECRNGAMRMQSLSTVEAATSETVRNHIQNKTALLPKNQGAKR